jgi:4-hydroxy-tetrahydrodipicolinate synthase
MNKHGGIKMTEDYIKGVYVPLATAFNKNGGIDTVAMKKLTQYMLENGVHGVMPAGSTGEFFALTVKDRKRLLEVVLTEVNGRIPVFAGTGAVTTRETIELTRQAESIGADGVLVITPFYISPSQDDLYEHYLKIAKCTRLPIIVYCNPGRTGGLLLTPDTVSRIAEIENIIALKDSSGNLALTAEYVKQTRGKVFSILMGQDKLFYAGLMHGCTALVAATANVSPALLVNLYNACVARDVERALSLQEKVTMIRDGFESMPFPVAAKAMIKMAGVSVGPPAAPLGLGKEITPEELGRLEKIVKTVT